MKTIYNLFVEAIYFTKVQKKRSKRYNVCVKLCFSMLDLDTSIYRTIFSFRSAQAWQAGRGQQSPYISTLEQKTLTDYAIRYTINIFGGL